MVQQIQVNNEIIEFPDGMSDTDIESVLSREFGQPEKVQTQQPTQKPESSFFERFARAGIPKGGTGILPSSRNVGLGARAVLQGISTIPAFVPDLATLGINAAFDTDIQPLSSIVSEGLSTVGFPEPQTPKERIVGEVISGATGGGVLAKGLQQLGTKVPKIIQQLASKPVVEIAAGGVGAGAAATTRELGRGTLAQLGVGLVTGGLAGVVATRLLRGKAQPTKLLSDIAATGLDEPQAFVKVRSALESEAKQLREKISGKFIQGKQVKPGLFDVAKKRGQNAFVDNEQIGQLSKSLKESLVGEIDKEVKEIVTTAVRDLDNLIKRSITITPVKKRLLEGLQGERRIRSITTITPIQINELEGIRRSASRIAKSGGSKGFAGGQVLRGIDDFLENAVVTGDQEAVSLWREAIKARREFGLKFEKPKKIALAVDSDQTLETIEKSFLGSGVVSTQKDLAKTYQETLRAVNPSKRREVGFAMRQSALNRMIRTAAQSSDTAEGLSASRLSNSIRNLKRENKSFWDKFNAAEKEELTKLSTELRKISKGGVINRVYTAFEKIISRGLRTNIELPRTLKAKTIINIDDLLQLSSFRPKRTIQSQAITPIAVIAPDALKQEQQ